MIVYAIKRKSDGLYLGHGTGCNHKREFGTKPDIWHKRTGPKLVMMWRKKSEASDLEIVELELSEK